MDSFPVGAIAAANSLDGSRLKVVVIGDGGILRDVNCRLVDAHPQNARLPNYLPLSDGQRIQNTLWTEGGVIDTAHPWSRLGVCTIEKLNIACFFYQLPNRSIVMRRCHMGPEWRWEDRYTTVLTSQSQFPPEVGTNIVVRPSVLRVGDRPNLTFFYQTAQGTLGIQKMQESGALHGPAFVTRSALPQRVPFTALTSGDEFTVYYTVLQTRQVWECRGSLALTRQRKFNEESYIPAVQDLVLSKPPNPPVAHMASYQAGFPVVYIMSSSPPSKLVWSTPPASQIYRFETRGMPGTPIVLAEHAPTRSSATLLFVDVRGAVNVGRTGSGTTNGSKLPDCFPIPLASMREAFGWVIKKRALLAANHAPGATAGQGLGNQMGGPSHSSSNTGIPSVTQRPAQAGTRPGQAAARPGQTGPRPGQTGPRPGQTGPRPGQTGPRPAQTGARPIRTGAGPAQPGARPTRVGPRPGQTRPNATHPGSTGKQRKPGANQNRKKAGNPPQRAHLPGQTSAPQKPSKQAVINSGAIPTRPGVVPVSSTTIPTGPRTAQTHYPPVQYGSGSAPSGPNYAQTHINSTSSATTVTNQTNNYTYVQNEHHTSDHREWNQGAVLAGGVGVLAVGAGATYLISENGEDEDENGGGRGNGESAGESEDEGEDLGDYSPGDEGEDDEDGEDWGYEDGGYEDGGYEDGGYEDGGYEDGGYEDGGYEDGGYEDGGYEDGGYEEGMYGGYEEGYDGGDPYTAIQNTEEGPVEIATRRRWVNRTRTGTVVAGMEDVAAGTEIVVAGTGVVAEGTEIAVAGTEAVVAGTEAAVVGTEVVAVGTEVVAVGMEIVAAGMEVVVAGTEVVAAGTEIVVARGEAVVAVLRTRKMIAVAVCNKRQE